MDDPNLSAWHLTLKTLFWDLNSTYIHTLIITSLSYIVKSATYYFMLQGLTLTLTELEADKHKCWRRVATCWETRTSHWYPSSNWYQAEKTKTGEWWNTRWWSCRNGEEHGTVYTPRTITTKFTGTSVSKFIPGRQDTPKANELWFAFSSDGRWANETILYALARANE